MKNYLSALRTRMSLTQIELAEWVGVTGAYVAQIETEGKLPPGLTKALYHKLPSRKEKEMLLKEYLERAVEEITGKNALAVQADKLVEVFSTTGASKQLKAARAKREKTAKPQLSSDKRLM